MLFIKKLLNSLLLLTAVLMSCAKNQNTIIFENKLISVSSSRYTNSDFEIIFDAVDLDEGIEFKHRYDNFSIVIKYDSYSFINKIVKDTSYLVFLSDKMKSEVSKNSICLYSKFENKYFHQCYLSYFDKINENRKLQKIKEIEISKLGESCGAKIVIEQKVSEYNLRTDFEWANDMVNNFNIVLKK